MVFYKNGTVIEKNTLVSLNTFTNRETLAKKSIITLNIQTALQNYGWTCVSPCYDKGNLHSLEWA